MKRIFLGILLDVIATIAMLFFVILPSVMPIDNVPGMRPILQGMLCESGERVDAETHTFSRPGRVTTSVNYFCVRESGARRDVTGRAVLIAMIGFGLPLVISIFLFISAGASAKKKRSDPDTDLLLQNFGISMGNATTRTIRMNSSDSGHGPLSERVNQFKTSYSQGTMTESDVKSLLQNSGISTDEAAFGQGGASPRERDGDDLIERLHILKDAYEHGLITEQEYERKRKDILREM